MELFNEFISTEGFSRAMYLELDATEEIYEFVFTNRGQSQYNPSKRMAFINIYQPMLEDEAGPAIITLGHEWGHAINHKRNKMIDKSKVNEFGVPLEEIQTIKSFENPLRLQFLEKVNPNYPVIREKYNGKPIK